jgi:lysine 6-dehydrogenase
LINTMPHIRHMREKTLRWPQHMPLVRALRDSGLFSDKAIAIDGRSIRPIDLTSRLLIDQWQLSDSEDEFTVMRTVCTTQDKEIVFDVFDRRDRASGLSSMSRTTGFTCAAVARLVLEGKVASTGIHAPEQIGQRGHYPDVEARLMQHGIRIEQSERPTKERA